MIHFKPNELGETNVVLKAKNYKFDKQLTLNIKYDNKLL